MTKEQFYKRYVVDTRKGLLDDGTYDDVYRAYDTVDNEVKAIKISKVEFVNGKEISLLAAFKAAKYSTDSKESNLYEIVYQFEMPTGLFDHAVLQHYPKIEATAVAVPLTGKLQESESYSSKSANKQEEANSKTSAVSEKSASSDVKKKGKIGKPILVAGVLIPLLLLGYIFGFNGNSNNAGMTNGMVETSNQTHVLDGSLTDQDRTRLLEEQEESKMWSITKKRNDVKAYEQFLSSFPNGKYSKQAQDFIDNQKALVKTKHVVEKQKTTEPTVREYAQPKTTPTQESPIERIVAESIVSKKITSENKPANKVALESSPPINNRSTETAPSKEVEERAVNEIAVVDTEDDYEEKIFPPIIQKIENELKVIRGGEFQMGCNDCEDDARPGHKIKVNTFMISKYEVDQELFQLVMGTNPSFNRNCDECPVDNVNYHDAQLFVKKLNQLSSRKYRLLTEAEWEYAAMGGSSHKYSGGDEINEVGHYKSNSRRASQKVGLKKPNGFGLFDMSGNVFEWCDTWYNRNGYRSSDNSEGKVIRGGSWNSKASACGIKNRASFHPDDKEAYIGFRIGRDIEY